MSIAALDKRERQMTWTILILILLNLLCWLPYQLSNIYIFVTRSEHTKSSENFYFDVFIGIFFTQYSLNFFVYIVRSDQYQKAFLYFIISSHRILNKIFMFSKQRWRSRRSRVPLPLPPRLRHRHSCSRRGGNFLSRSHCHRQKWTWLKAKFRRRRHPRPPKVGTWHSHLKLDQLKLLLVW